MKTKFTLYPAMVALCAATGLYAQPANFSPRGVGGGGALFFPRINPANDNEFYIACDMSEMFHSTNFGDSYSQIHFSKLPTLNVSTYEFTGNPNVAYNNYNDGNEGYPVKTNDGGNTWTPLAGFDANQGGVYRMAANYNKPNQLLMNYYGQIVISQDSGATFSLVKQATNNGAGIIMGGVFFTGDSIYIGTNEGLLYSTNGGGSFSTMATTGIPASDVIWTFSGAKNGGTMRFVCITGANNNTYNGIMPWDYWGYATGVYTMDNANGTWTPASTGINLASEFVMYTGMAWNDVNTIYLSGSDNGTPLVYKSTNGGGSWTKVFNTTGNLNITTGWSGYNGDKGWTWGETAFGIAVAPNNSNKLLFGDFGFVHVSSDGGATWKQAYVDNNDDHTANATTPTKQYYHSIGLENTTCWQVTWQSPSTMFAAYSDIGGIRSADSGKSWGYTYNGMSVNSVYRVAKSPGGVLYAGTSGIHDMYQSTRLKDAQLDANDGNGKIMYSTDMGANWSAVHTFNHPVFWLAIDPNDSNKAYASVIDHDTSIGGIYVCSNLSNHASSTWTKLPAPPRTEGHPASIIVLNDGKVLCTFSGRITSGGTWTASSGVFLYDPATGTWADKSDPNMQYWTKDIVPDPTDAAQNTWYACVFSAWGNAGGPKGGLYKTTNRGTSWTKLTGTQFDRVTSITFDPGNANNAYLTTETQGLNFSNNMNTASPTFALVSSYPFRQPERVYFNPYDSTKVWVSSFGNGMKVGDLAQAPNRIPIFENEQAGLLAYPNPATASLTVDLQRLAGINTVLEVHNISGQLIGVYSIKDKKSLLIDTHTWPAGSYLLSCGRYFTKVVKQ
ncbi:MAG: T9SS type A sorting domain-containing protein [Bacteroidetes bacterium]|nr:T9SS type A sorting domain-containing protein [Bacteroidota bacterium]